MFVKANNIWMFISFFNDECNLIYNAGVTVQYWPAPLIVILHEPSHTISCMEVPIANNKMSGTAPGKTLNKNPAK